MNQSSKAGTVIRLLCLPIATTLLASCNRAPPEKTAKPSEAEEVQQDVEAIKNHPSLQPGSNQAGAPLHFDPYPKPKPPAVTHDEHAHHDTAKH